MRRGLTAVSLLVVWGCADNAPTMTVQGADSGNAGDAAQDSATRDVTADAPEASAILACTRTLAVGCSPFHSVSGSTVDFSNCPPTWNDAIAFCITNAGDYGFAETDCGTYRRFRVENGDVGCSYYYAEATLDLVAVFCDTGCLAGPSGFNEPACAPIQPQEYRPCAPGDVLGDGGSDGDAPGAD